MNKLTPLAVAVALAPVSVFAAASDSFDDQLKQTTIVVTSSRQVEPQEQATSTTTVFTRADIERLQPASVQELFQRVPGVQINQSGGRGSLSGLFVRGTKSAQTLVLVDGVRINGADSGTAALEALSVDQIERVEVLRGARSVIYGADAIGGVIQIFTRRSHGQGVQPRLHLGYGTYGTWERSYGVSGGDEATRFSINVSADETKGSDRTTVDANPADSDKDGYRNNAFSASLSHRYNDRIEVGVSLLDQRGETEYDQGWTGVYPYDDFQLSTLSGYLNAQVTERWHSRLELGHAENRRFSNFDDVASSSAFNTYRDSAASINRIELDDRQQLTLGVDWYDERLNGYDSFAKTSRWNRAGFLQHRYDGAGFGTEIGVRIDDNEIYGSEDSWSAALILPFGDANTLTLSYSEGFRAPSFVDLYYPGYSNPDLQPETSQSYELQWRSELTPSTQLQASLFRTDIDDAIVLDSSYTPQNIGSARIDGIELALQQQWRGWDASLGLSIIDPVDRDSDKTLVRRAKRTLNLDLDRQFGDFAVGGSWLLVSRAWNDADNTQAIDGHGLVNLRGSWQVRPSLKLALKVDNLLDRDYATALYSVYNPDWSVSNYPYHESGRTALLSLTWTPQI